MYMDFSLSPPLSRDICTGQSCVFVFRGARAGAKASDIGRLWLNVTKLVTENRYKFAVSHAVWKEKDEEKREERSKKNSGLNK